MASKQIHIKDFSQLPGRLSDDRLTWEFPVIKTQNARGRETFWKIYVRVIDKNGKFVRIRDEWFTNLPEGYSGWIKVDSGVVGGKVKASVPTIVSKGKNIGKANATNPFTQALRDALGLYNKQKDKAEVGMDMYPPMLSQLMRDQVTPPTASIDAPLFVQRKYNGLRAVATYSEAEKTIILYSRRRNRYPGLTYIRDELLPAISKYWNEGRKLYLDGELYKHGMPLQDISGYARREHKDPMLEFVVYDCFIVNELDLKFSERKIILDEIFAKYKFKHTKLADTYMVVSDAEINKLYEQFLREGYEGAMVRVDAPYRFSYNEYHSNLLLKMKPELDHEFEIVGWKTGDKGKAAKALMIICKTESGVEFPVTPAMTLEERVELAKKMGTIEPNGKTHFENHWLGRKLIVTFDEWSKDRVPLRARTRMEIRTWD